MVDVNELDSLAQEVEKARCPYATLYEPEKNPQPVQIFTLFKNGKSVKYFLKKLRGNTQ